MAYLFVHVLLNQFQQLVQIWRLVVFDEFRQRYFAWVREWDEFPTIFSSGPGVG
jgi:hypothetical protein